MEVNMESNKSEKEMMSAFIAMPFDTRLQTIYSKVFKPGLESHGFVCTRADEMREPGIIMEQIKIAISEANLILGDLTFNNANVFYEIGIAHSLSKLTLLFCQRVSEIPFDLKLQRVERYEDTKEGLLDLRDRFEIILSEHFPIDTSTNKPLIPRTFIVSTNEKLLQREALFSNSSEVKRYAIKYLGDNSDHDSYNIIEGMATIQKDPDLVRDAFTSLVKIDPAKAYAFLIERGLRHQEHFLVRERVVYLLGKYPCDKDLFKQIIDQRRDSSWGVRRAVCNVLGRWDNIEAMGYLHQMLADPEPDVRSAADEALTRLNQVRAAYDREKMLLQKQLLEKTNTLQKIGTEVMENHSISEPIKPPIENIPSVKDTKNDSEKGTMPSQEITK
jgi:hypothetical protein